MNKILLEGRLGKDAEVRESNGVKFLSMTIAENQFVGKEKKTFWYDVMCFNYNDKLVQYYKKGGALFITGQLTADIEEGKDSVTRCRRRIVADAIDFVSTSKSETTETTEAKEPANAATNTSMYGSKKTKKEENLPEPIVTTAGESGNIDNSDLPF